MRDSWQLLADCPHCLVESALVEIVEAAEPAPRTLESRCRLCGFATVRGDVRAPPRRFRGGPDVLDALGAWAREEGEPDVALFCRANFGGLDLAAVTARVLARERVETGFDVIAWLFPSAGMGAAATSDAAPGMPRHAPVASGTRSVVPWTEIPATIGRAAPVAPQAEAASPAVPAWSPRDIARALYAVALADGELRPRETQFIERYLQSLGGLDLPADEQRVWRPTELPIPPDPDPLLAAMRVIALCDGDLDGSEVRVLREYARAWRAILDERGLVAESSLARAGKTLFGVFVR